MVLRSCATPWAILTLWRRPPRAPFTPAEAELIGGLSEPLGDAVRAAVRASLSTPQDRHPPPGVLTVDPHGRLLAADDHAATWLRELPCQDAVPTGFGLVLPAWLLATSARSRSLRCSGGDGVARALVPSERDRWVGCRATTTCDASGAPAGTVVVLEAAAPVLMAPIIAGACGLTAREQEIARLIARGAGTSEIAASLFLSSHTVRDHVKSLLHKVGVSSRGELVATLYTGQIVPSAASSAPPAPHRPSRGSPERGMAARTTCH